MILLNKSRTPAWKKPSPVSVLGLPPKCSVSKKGEYSLGENIKAKRKNVQIASDVIAADRGYSPPRLN